jgi:hypothetical protein
MADGKVLVNGGSYTRNELINVAYHNEIWDPKTGKWTRGAIAAKPRLYHSSALLLMDGTVLTGGGGAPGPVINLNSEIFYPPYLFKKDGSGQLAPRPVISSAPDRVTWGQNFGVTVEGTVKRATWLRFGSSTHNFNADQRFLEAEFRQDGNVVTVTAPSNARVAPPGHYMLFVFDPAGVPSEAKAIKIGPAA